VWSAGGAVTQCRSGRLTRLRSDAGWQRHRSNSKIRDLHVRCFIKLPDLAFNYEIKIENESADKMDNLIKLLNDLEEFLITHYIASKEG
jgi:hypothetical protein